ncbi:P-loop containing nucleoside triphosphate hydrolase protein [Pilaira anomala]|nr:P-loop containing nucleoside triphosphate hydrolase protein [Pilaira anomala]
MTTPTVRVALRVRPLLYNDSDQDEVMNETLNFDQVYSTSATQYDIYKTSILPLLDSFIKGQNMTVLAYGKSGSGKSYTMGTGEETHAIDQGIIQRFSTGLFDRMIEFSSKSLGSNSYEVFVCCAEFDHEMKDVLNTSGTGINQVKVTSTQDLLKLLKPKSKTSSHLMFSILLKQYVCNDDMFSLVENDIPITQVVSKIHFVDLAGSERTDDLDDGLIGILSRIGQASKEESNQIFLISCIYATELKDLKKLSKLNQLQQTTKKQDEISILKKEIQQLKKTFSTELAKVKKERDNALQNNNKKRLDDLFVDNTKKITTIHSSSSSSSNRRKKPVMHRMKSTHSSSLVIKKKNHNHDCSHSSTMDDLLDLLRREYLLAQQDTNKSIDETVLHTSAALPLPQETTSNIMPDTPPPVTDEDELEALSVPSWSDGPKTTHGYSKRKSISLDSMWDDTDSSITTSRIPSTTTTARNNTTSIPKPMTQTKSKDLKRQSRNLLKMLHQIQADLLVKRELVGQLEKTEDQYATMKHNYEERLNELKDHLFELQHERDLAIKKTGATIVPKSGSTRQQQQQTVLQLRENRQAQEVRSQYEVKLKLLVTENAELRKKQTQSTQAIQQARSKAEGIIGRLRADIEGLKLDKKQLVKKIKTEADKSRDSSVVYEREIQQLKRREVVALESKKKIEQALEAQVQVAKKRTEETAAVNLQIRHLTNVLRRAANEGTFLNEVSLERLLNEANYHAIKTTRRSTSKLFGTSSTTSLE